MPCCPFKCSTQTGVTTWAIAEVARAEAVSMLVMTFFILWLYPRDLLSDYYFQIRILFCPSRLTEVTRRITPANPERKRQDFLDLAVEVDYSSPHAAVPKKFMIWKSRSIRQLCQEPTMRNGQLTDKNQQSTNKDEHFAPASVTPGDTCRFELFLRLLYNSLPNEHQALTKQALN